MNNLIEHSGKKASENEQADIELHAKSGENGTRGPKRKHLILGAIVVCVMLVCLCAYWTIDTVRVGADAAVATFNNSKDEASEDAYQFFYENSYNAAEKAHHVSNDVSITIGDLQEEQKLEVLRVSDISYEVPTPEDQKWFEQKVTKIIGFFSSEILSWLEVPGSGIFTVNLQEGEFITDEARHYVLIRVPTPELTEFTIDYNNVELLLFEKGGVFKDSAEYGVDKAMEQLKSAELTMKQNLSNNQGLYKRAQEAAENILENLVKQLNPHLPNLTVEVEFID